MSLVSLCVLVQLLGPDGRPLEGIEKVDGRAVSGAELSLDVGLHRLTARGREGLFYVPAPISTDTVDLTVNLIPRIGDYGVSMRRHRHVGVDAAVEAVADAGWVGLRPLGYELSPTLPETVRVARYADNDCRSTLLRVDEVALESYVAGVVNAEIGVFAAAGSGPGLQIPADQRRDRVFASFQTFAVAARTYVLWWYLRQGPAAEFHIKDGPCNQVYKDDRTEIATAAATTTAGQILVAEFDQDLLDKHEYASACARRGTLPSYKSATPVDPDDIIPDDGLSRVCVRNWCGHDNERMAHQDNPLFPAGNRSLVRGICQWGSVERAVRGDSYLQILSHYQPLLRLRTVGADVQFGALAGELSNAATGEAIYGAQIFVSLEGDERSARSDREGQYELADLDPGTWDVHIRADGYVSQDDRILVEAGSVRYAHFQLEPVNEETNPPDAGPIEPEVDAGPETPVQEDRDAPVGCSCGSVRGAFGGSWLAFFIAWTLFGPLRRSRRRANPSL